MTSTLTSPIAGNVKKAMTGASSADLWMVPVANLKIDPSFNCRIRDDEYEAQVAWLTEQIIDHGYDRTKPMAGYVAKEGDENVVYITDGHRRFEAVQRAIDKGHPVERIPVVTHPAGTSAEDLVTALVTSNSGQPLKPYEVATVIKRLQGFGLNESEIAKRLSYTREYVVQLLELLAAPADVRKMVTSGQVAATLAVETVRKVGAGAGAALAQGLEVAKASGKSKVTRKHVLQLKLPGLVEKPKGTTITSCANDAYARAIRFAISVGPDAAEFLRDWELGDVSNWPKYGNIEKCHPPVDLEIIRELVDYVKAVRVGDDAADLIKRAEELL